MDQDSPPPVTAGTPPSNPLPSKFRVHVVSAALAVVAMVGHVLGGYGQGVRNHNIPEGIGVGIGEGLVLVGIAFFVGWLCFRLFRSNLLANGLLCLAILCGNCCTGSAAFKNGMHRGEGQPRAVAPGPNCVTPDAART